MTTSLVLPRVTFEPLKLTKLPCKGIDTNRCIDFFPKSRRQSCKSCSTTIRSGKLTTQVSSLIDVENKIDDKKVVVSDGLGVVSFITGKVFLVTGATGFLAKVLIEKILRTVPDVGKIYILVKAKDRDAAMHRIQTEIMNTELFKPLEQTHGKSYQTFILSKLVPVVGDLCESNLGMEVGLSDEIANEVDIMINSGCSTVFDERLDFSLDTNTLGPSRFLSFAKTCKKLKLFVHISSAYVNGERQGVIKEKPFNQGDSIAKEKASLESSVPILNVEDEVKMALEAKESFDDKIVSQKMKEFGLERAKTYGWHDTYVFTKAMGEMIINNERGDIPMVILRPSAIESTFSEPIKGWIQGIRMLDPLIVYYGKGVLTGFPVDPNGVIDVVPADMVVNAILAATVKHGTISKPGLSVYHVGSSVSNPLVWKDLFSYCFDYFHSSPYMDPRKGPNNVEEMKLFGSVDEFLTHSKEEANRKCPEKRSRKVQKELDTTKHLAILYEPYMFYKGRFDNYNTEELFEEMSQEEKRSFGFDVRSIDWKDYICNTHIRGVLTHALKGRGM